MDVSTIKNPKFLKKLSVDQMTELADDIRSFLIQKLSKTGGHLAPNLGVVELTLALHKVFHSPVDKLIWDVGHQSYVHKILTGRGDQFDTLRQHKGLCGFPKRSESKHDVWETGHSSTSLSAALGMAVARDLKHEHFDVVAVIGDGALTGGMALEALNDIGHQNRNMIIVLNDNEMSIAPNVGALHNMLNRIRSANKYNRAKEDLEYLMKKIPAFGGKLASVAEGLKDRLKYLLVSGVFFEELGITYLGPVDGHNINALIDNLNYAQKRKGPVLIHVLTQKGKGYRPAEMDEIGTWHGTGPYKIESGAFIKPAALAPAYSQVVNDELQELARHDERIVVVSPAMVVGSKLEGFAQEFPDRLFDVGIAEQHAATFAAGLATQNMKPVLSIYSTFMQRAYDQLVHDLCRQNLNVVLAVDRAGLVGADGETHQGVFDIGFLRALPNLVVMMGKDESELRNMVYTAIHYNKGPIAVRYPRGNGIGVPMKGKPEALTIGSWEVLRDGTDATVLAFGPMLQVAVAAAKQLESEGFHLSIVNARFIKPMDGRMLDQIAKQQTPILTVEEGMLAGGFGSGVLEYYHDHGVHDLVIERMGIEDRFVEHGSVKELLNELGLTAEQIAHRVKKMIHEQTHRNQLRKVFTS
ncbi:1-deoxy-D-xylulose-5-phosphate synthase [Sporolactobacillus inulinus]|uniref:1-deoxy-D-xylulose-5-phosphate synthase n=2 Tax=Sporolactobacillus inulinus TaxID=2078 RepID=A0A0U1QSE0_9BACL|nr:1-deoxy-D-xylulose-5-phosphate synthase [Sporolactobacillus inulinus]KLI03652.1 1-deoxy-D-xylulose-5-phosphate synthase [Sporolactobacillus inulinus CASD]GEB76504.1 1-deoxy-D-xylulose-5-phosphate synthase [Sporolactobacillus inulinus]